MHCGGNTAPGGHYPSCGLHRRHGNFQVAAARRFARHHFPHAIVRYLCAQSFPYSAVRELRVVTLMVGNFGGMYGKLKPENFICLSLDGQIPAPETRLTELYGSLDCLTFAYTKEAMTFLNQKIPPAV